MFWKKDPSPKNSKIWGKRTTIGKTKQKKEFLVKEVKLHY
jgi:hypothetical protein